MTSTEKKRYVQCFLDVLVCCRWRWQKTTIVCKTQACFANGCCFHQRQNHTQARRENIEVKWPPHIYVVAVIQINNSILSFTEILWHKPKALVIHPSLPRIFIRLCLLAARLAFLQTLMRWKDFSAAAAAVRMCCASLPPSGPIRANWSEKANSDNALTH